MATVEYLVVGGGGAGGRSGSRAGGGGAGGYRTATGFTVTAQNYSITVGAGGASRADSGTGASGADSVFSTITAVGGGGGGGSATAATSGGSGGGGGGTTGVTAGGAGTSGQGNKGGEGLNNQNACGGGGGSGSAGVDATNGVGGNGGTGTASSITGSSLYYAAGGGGSGTTNGTGGSSIGGNGSRSTTGSAGTDGTGSGGGAGTPNYAGGTGIVIIRYKTDGSDGVSTSSTGGTITTSGDYTIHKFTSSGTFGCVLTGGSSPSSSISSSISASPSSSISSSVSPSSSISSSISASSSSSISASPSSSISSSVSPSSSISSSISASSSSSISASPSSSISSSVSPSSSPSQSPSASPSQPDYLFYPQAGHGGDNVSVDCSLYRAVFGTTLADLISGAGTDTRDPDYDYLILGLNSYYTGLDSWYALERVILTFDTSSLGSGIHISSAILHLYVHIVDDDLSVGTFNVVGATPASDNNVIASDYIQLGTTKYSSDISLDQPTGQYIHIPLNDDGIASIAKTGITKLGLRFTFDGLGGTNPTWQEDMSTQIFFNSADIGTNKPYLEIIPGSASPSPSTSISSSVSPSSSSSSSPSPSPLPVPSELRDFTNRPGIEYDANKTTVVFAEDMALIKEWIEYLNSKL